MTEVECEACGEKDGIEALAEHEAELGECECVYQVDEEEEDLKSLSLPRLCDLCADVSAKEVMTDRIVRHNVAAGHFAEPMPQEEKDAEDGGETTSKSREVTPG